MSLPSSDPSSLLSLNQLPPILEKVNNKIKNLSRKDKIAYIKAKIEQIQEKYGNKPQIIFVLTEKYINIQKEDAEDLYNAKKFDEAIQLYKQCLRQTEPLPGSEWQKYPNWIKLRISLMNNIALISQKMDKMEQAIEYLRLGMNLEETYNEKGDYDSKFNGIFFSTGNQLMVLEQYDEALKYLLKIEKKIFDEHISKILKRKKIDKKLDRNFLENNPSKYLILLNMICKAYIKLGNYSKSDIYYERYNEMETIMQKAKIGINAVKRSRGETETIIYEKNRRVNSVPQKSTIGKVCDRAESPEPRNLTEVKNVEEDEKDYDANTNENFSSSSKKNSSKKPVFSFDFDKMRTRKKRRLGSLSPSVLKSQEKSSEGKIKTEERKSKSNIKKKKKKLNEIIRQENKYPPLEFKFKKPLFPKQKKIPLIELKSLKRPSLSLPKIPSAANLKTEGAAKKRKQTVKPKSQEEKKESKMSKIKNKIKDIEKTLERQSSIKSIDTFNSFKLKTLNKSSSMKSYSSKEENDVMQNTDKKENEFERKTKKKQTEAPKKPILPPLIPKKNRKKTTKLSSNQVKKLEFPSEMRKKNVLFSSESRKSEDQESKESSRDFFNHKSKSNVTSVEFDFAEKIRKENERRKEREFSSSVAEQSSHNNTDVKPSSNDKIQILPLLKDPLAKIEKIELRSDANQKKKKPTRTAIDLTLSNLPNLIKKYFTQAHLKTETKFNKGNLIKKTFQIMDIYILKEISSKYFKIHFTLPFLSVESATKNDYLLSDVFFESFSSTFPIKYLIKVFLLKELQTSSEELKNEITRQLQQKKRDLNLSWSIYLYYFENWFQIFKNKYEILVLDNINEENRRFYKSYIEKINDYIENINQWETKNILMSNENKYINILLKYFTVLVKFITLVPNVIGDSIILKKVDQERRKNQQKNYLNNQLNTLSMAKYLNQEGNKNLLKKLLYDSFQIKEVNKFYPKTIKKKEEKIEVVNFEDFFYDNEVLFKGITRLENKYMFISISVRTFDNVLRQKNQIHLTELPTAKIISKSELINFNKLGFLSVDEDIKGLYKNLDVDLTTKFYGKTRHKTFLQFSTLALASASNWFDFSYVSWEMFDRILQVFRKDTSYKNFLNINATRRGVSESGSLRGIIGGFVLLYIQMFCKIDKGNFIFIYDVNQKEAYLKMFNKLYKKFDIYFKAQSRSTFDVVHNYTSISYYHKHFYFYFLKEIHDSYYKLYFKKHKYFYEERLAIKDEHEEIEKDEILLDPPLNPVRFSVILIIKNNVYNTFFDLKEEVVSLTLDKDDIKNYLVEKKTMTTLFIQMRSILTGDLIHYRIKKEKIIRDIISCYDNNSEKLLKIFLQNYINVIKFPYSKKMVLELGYKKFLVNKQVDVTSLDLLKKISIMIQNKTNEKLHNIIDSISYIKNYKSIFVNKEKNKLLFYFQIFSEGRLIEEDNTEEFTDIQTQSLYQKCFGVFKQSKFESKLNEKYHAVKKKKKKFENYLFYFIDVYDPKKSRHYRFILSTYDLNVVLKKIKNKSIHSKYLTSVNDLINLIPGKITIKNTEYGSKLYLNFTKYKNLRMDWKSQLQKKKPQEENLLNNVMKKTKKKFELKIYLKQNYVNILSKECLYDISTNETELIIKQVKIYHIKEHSYSCIVSISYHHILEYWTLNLFFPHNSRKFTTILEPKEVTRIIRTQNFVDMNVIDEGKISERDIWKYVIESSYITSNIEGNAFFQVFKTKLLLHELLYTGFEVISDGQNEELNRIIYITITLKKQNLFLLDAIEKIVPKVELDTTFVIFQCFSFHDLSWHKEHFKVEDFEPFFKEKIIYDENVVKVREISKFEQMLNESPRQENSSNTILKPKMVEKSKVEVVKHLPFCELRKMTVPIIKPYVNSQQHIFEKQMESFEKKGIEGGDLKNLIDNVKNDLAHKKAVSSIYRQKLENQILFQKIYSEYISYNPPILAHVGLNLVKETVIISLYYPYQTNSYDIKVDFDTIKHLFFPYFNDILIIDKMELGKRIMKKYEYFIRKSPHFLKLFKK